MLPRRRSRAGSRATETATGAAGGRGDAVGRGGEHDAVVGREERASSSCCSCARRALSSSTFWNICTAWRRGHEGACSRRGGEGRGKEGASTHLLDELGARVGDGVLEGPVGECQRVPVVRGRGGRRLRAFGERGERERGRCGGCGLRRSGVGLEGGRGWGRGGERHGAAYGEEGEGEGAEGRGVGGARGGEI